MRMMEKANHRRLQGVVLLPAALRSARLPSCIESTTPAKAGLSLSPQVQVLHKYKKPDNNAIITVANTGNKITGDYNLKKTKDGLDMGSTSVCYSDF